MIKKYWFLLAVMMGSHLSTLAQVGYNEIHVNNIKTGMHANGSMFMNEDFNGGNFIWSSEDGTTHASTIYTGTLWISALDIVGSIGTAVSLPGSLVHNTPGPAHHGILNIDYNKVWKVTKEEIEAHLEDISDGTIDNPISSGIMEWPASDENRLLPFFDYNEDGVYNPQKGDYPTIGRGCNIVVPSEFLYAVYHSVPTATSYVPNVEVHVFMYAFDDDSHPELRNTVFTRHMIQSHANNDYLDFRVGFFQDTDVGCNFDDYMGCDTTLNMMFAYNKDAIDGDENGYCDHSQPTFGDNPPVHSTILLNHYMDSYVTINNEDEGNPPASTTYPERSMDYYNVLGGTYKDGSMMTIGGIGYDTTSTDYTKYNFHDDPNDPDGWSMYTANIPSYSSRGAVAAIHKGRMVPGEVMIIDMAHTVTRDPALNHIETVTAAKNGAKVIEELYRGFFYFICGSPNISKKYNVTVYPNPTLGDVHIVQKGEFTNYELFNNIGSTVAHGKIADTKTKLSTNLPSGIYYLKLTHKTNGNQHVEALVIK